MSHSVLIVTTSVGTLPDGRETGFDWASLAVPYWRLREAGTRLGFASVAGGRPPGDPGTAGDGSGERLGAVEMFLGDPDAIDGLARSAPAGEVDASEWDAILFADGLGGLWDLAGSDAIRAMISTAWEGGAILVSIGAGAAALCGAADGTGRTLIAGRRLTCLPDAAIRAALDGEDAPMMPETRLKARGAQVYAAPEDETPEVIEDGRVITGQDGHVSADVALELLDALDVYGGVSVGPDEAAPGGASPDHGEGASGEGDDPAAHPGTRTP